MNTFCGVDANRTMFRLFSINICIALLRIQPFILETDAFLSIRPRCNGSKCMARLLQATKSDDVVDQSKEPQNTFLFEAQEKNSFRNSSTTRRKAILQTAASFFLGISFPGTTLADEPTAATGGIVPASKIYSLLHPIPTFALVDPSGTPYFVVGEDAKLTSYFFISYGEARRILDVARSSADKALKEGRKELLAKKKLIGGPGSNSLTKEEETELGVNPWISARITSVPLDVAVSLASKGKVAGAYWRLAPSESDIEDALMIDGSDDLPEGKVPLFYVEDMTLSSLSTTSENDTKATSPLYFEKSQLLAEWKQQNKGNKSDPDVKVTELFATLTEMARPGGTNEELNSLVFVAPTESKAKAAECLRGEKEPFRFGERIIVL